MAHRLIWSPPALDDIERDSEFYAGLVVQRVFVAPEVLRQFPQSGRIVPETNAPHIRELFVHDYRLMYELTDDEVHILAVIHGKRDFNPETLTARR